jgi:hypothetical protein
VPRRLAQDLLELLRQRVRGRACPRHRWRRACRRFHTRWRQPRRTRRSRRSATARGP